MWCIRVYGRRFCGLSELHFPGLQCLQWKNQKVLIHDSVQYPAEKKEVLRLRLRMTAFMLRNLDSGDEVPSELTALLYRVSFIHFPLCYKNRMRTLFSCLFLLLICNPTAIFAGAKPAWTTPIAPFQIADNLYYVGSEDLASYLVVTPKGNILINANLASSPPQIRASVEKLGFRWSDTRILLNGQAHYDHVAGSSQIIRETHAKNMVMDGDVSVMETGGRADFLSPSPNILTFDPVHVDRVLHDASFSSWRMTC
jgi:hypothetical protein